MLGVAIAAIVTLWVAYAIWKGYKTQTVIFLGGLILLACSILIGRPIIDGESSLGFAWFDIFKAIEDFMSKSVTGLGLMIMSVAGFVRYMDIIGANKSLVQIGTKPLRFISSPYILLAVSYIIGQVLKMAIISAAGLGLLLMATLFPILVGLGVNRAAAAAVIVSASAIDLGPASATSQFVAKTAGIDAATYISQYQLKIALPVIITIAVLHYVTNKWLDRKEGYKAVRLEVAASVNEGEEKAPRIYALLPILPLTLIFIFSSVTGSEIKMSVISAMLLGMFISMLFEYIRYRDFKKVAKSIQGFFDGMGSSFATVVSLIVAAGTFATGLTQIGAIDTLINTTQSAGFGSHLMTIAMQVVIAGSAFITGSSDASVFSFGALAPQIAQQFNINSVEMLLPMQFTGSIFRSASPVSAVVIAVSGIAALSPFDVVRRTAIPMVGAVIVTTIATIMLI